MVSIINDQIMEVEAMNLTACNLAQKLDSLQDIEGGKFEVVYASAGSATRISDDNFNRGSFRRIQIVNIVFRQHIAVYRSKKFVVFFRGR